MVLVGEIDTLRRTEGDMEFVFGSTFDRGGHALTGCVLWTNLFYWIEEEG